MIDMSGELRRRLQTTRDGGLHHSASSPFPPRNLGGLLLRNRLMVAWLASLCCNQLEA